MTAVSVASRTRWFVLALSPLLAIRIGQSPLRISAALCLSLSLTAAFAVSVQLMRRQPVRHAWLDEANWAVALLLPLWFGTTLPLEWLALALVAASASRWPFGSMGSMGRQIFHPAMVGAALLPVIGQTDASDPAPLATGVACTVAAVILAGRLRRDLRAPIALVLSFLAAHALMTAIGPVPAASADWAQLALAAGLVANDPVTTPVQSAARIVFGIGAGITAAVLPVGAAAIPCALLAMQAAAPWLDRAAGGRHAINRSAA